MDFVAAIFAPPYIRTLSVQHRSPQEITTPDPTGDALKACPICGGENLYISRDDEYNDVTYEVGCRDCQVSISRDLRDHATRVWNTRTPPPVSLDEVADTLQTIIRRLDAAEIVGAWNAADELLTRITERQ